VVPRRGRWNTVCARGAYLALASTCGRSASPLGDAETVVLFTVPFFVVLVVPYALLALAGVLLWRRRRTFATLLMALGFAATFAGQVAGFHVSHEVGAAVRSHQDASLVLAHHHYIFPMLTHYANLLELWAAAVGMVWHAVASR